MANATAIFPLGPRSRTVRTGISAHGSLPPRLSRETQLDVPSVPLLASQCSVGGLHPPEPNPARRTSSQLIPSEVSSLPTLSHSPRARLSGGPLAAWVSRRQSEPARRVQRSRTASTTHVQAASPPRAEDRAHDQV